MNTDWSGFTNFFDFIAAFIQSVSDFINYIIDMFAQTFGYMGDIFDWFRHVGNGFSSFQMFQLMISISLCFLLLKFVRWGK